MPNRFNAPLPGWAFRVYVREGSDALVQVAIARVEPGPGPRSMRLYRGIFADRVVLPAAGERALEELFKGPSNFVIRLSNRGDSGGLEYVYRYEKSEALVAPVLDATCEAAALEGIELRDATVLSVTVF